MPERPDLANSLQAKWIVRKTFVDRTADAGVHFGTAERFVIDLLTNRTFHKSRSGEVKPASFGHEKLIAKNRQISAAGNAVTHDRGELRNSRGTQYGVVAKDAAEIVFVWKNVFLKRQENAGRIDQIHKRQSILPRDSLCAENLFCGRRKERTGFDRGIVSDDHRAATGDCADTGDDTCSWRTAPLIVHLMTGPETELEQRTAGVDDLFDSFTSEEPTFGMLPFDCRLTTAESELLFLLLELLRRGHQERIDSSGHDCQLNIVENYFAIYFLKLIED